MLYLTVVLFVASVVFLILYAYKNAKDRPENFPPGPPKLPIYGSYWLILKENFTFSHLSFEKLAKRYKTDLLGLYLGNAPTVVALSLKLSKELLTRDEFIGRVDTVAARVRSFGKRKGIFFNDGLTWKQHRRFSLRHMRDYGFGRRSDVLEDFIKDEINYLINFLDSDPKSVDLDICKKKGVVLLPEVFSGPLTNIILLILTSSRFDYHELRPYARAAHRFMKSGDGTGGALEITPWLRFIAPKYFGYTSAVDDNAFIIEFLKGIVEEHLKTFSDDHHRDYVDDFISESLRQGVVIDYEQLLMVVLDYMFPTPIGLAHSVGFFFTYMVNNLDVQAKVHEEIDRVVGRSRLPGLDDRKSMPYCEATVREVLRILPVTPLGLPRRCMEDTTLGGYFIPKDTILLANLWTAHRDTTVFTNPNQFRPERFLDDHGYLLKNDPTISFGAGKRLCAGETFARQNMFLVCVGLMQNFTFTSPTSVPLLLNYEPGMTLSLKEVWVKAESR